MQSSHTRTPKIIGSLAVAIVIGIGGFLVINGVGAQQTSSVTTTTSSSSAAQATTPTTPASTTPTTTNSSSSSDLTYKNGTYSATASYRVPGGQNSLTVALTIASDKITAVKTTSSYDDRESQRYVDSFESGISSAVVGSSLADAYVGRVGGATLTTGAFDDTLQTIMNNAKA